MHRPAAAPEPRIEFKGAVDHHERKRRAEAVAVDDDLVGIGLAREAHQFPREAVEPIPDSRTNAMNEIARKIPVIERKTNEKQPSECQAQHHENGERERRRLERGVC